jgi:nitric oxide synthase-interacting protein
MTRHGLNATNHSVYSQQERAKDKKQSGYGSKRVRLGKDAVKGFDCCSLTLQPTAMPVITPQGYIFDKESILTFIVDKKKEYDKKLKKYEAQLEEEKQNFRDTDNKEEEDKRKRFEATEKNIVTKRVDAFKQEAGFKSVSNTATGELKRHLPAFWMPAMGPQAKKTKLTKPDKTVYCPMSRQPLRAKDLIDVKWTMVRDPDVKTSVISREERYQCAVTGDTLYNCTPAAVLRPTGDVVSSGLVGLLADSTCRQVTVECVDKIIRKDMRHPLTGQSLKEKEIIPIQVRTALGYTTALHCIPLQRGATGFSSANQNLIAEKEGAAMSIG